MQSDLVENVRKEAEALDENAVGDICIDSSNLSVPEVVQRVRGCTSGWPTVTSWNPLSTAVEHGGPTRTHTPPDGTILWLCGATGVGKSTVGFAVYQRALRAGMSTAFVDLDQIGFCGTAASDHRMKARILVSMWENYRAKNLAAQAGRQLVTAG